MLGSAYASGIIAPERADRVVKRLMGKDMWSGCGNPDAIGGSSCVQSIQLSDRGRCWPHDNSLIALGMRRYGFPAEAAAVARDISRAAKPFSC